MALREPIDGFADDEDPVEQKAKEEAEAAEKKTKAKKTRTKKKTKAPPPESAPSGGIAYDASLILQPGGVLQDLTEWMARTAKRSQPILALGASTALVGLLCAHKYRIIWGGYDTRSNVLEVGLAGSGGGKDHPRRCLKAVLAGLRMSGFIKEDVASGQGVEGAFGQRHANIFVLDEYGHRMAAALHPRGNQHEHKIVEVITKLSTSASGIYIHTTSAIHRIEEVPITYDPCLVGFFTTVEDRLWGAMQSSHINDGSIARHIFLRPEIDYPDNNLDPEHFEVELPAMVAKARDILTGGLGDLERSRRIGSLLAGYDPEKGRRVQPTEPPVMTTVPIDGEAQAELRRLDAEELALLRQHQSGGTNAIVARLVEHVCRHALICAVSDCPAAPHVTRRHVAWAEALVKSSLNIVLHAAAVYVADSEHQANRNKLLRNIMRVSGGSWVPRSAITKASQWAKDRDRSELLFGLVRDAFVEHRQIDMRGQKVDEFRC